MADEPDREEPAADPPRILIVDDEPSVRALLEHLCQREGFAYDVAENVAQAKDLLVPNRLSLLVVDKNLPDGTGMDVLQAARSSAE